MKRRTFFINGYNISPPPLPERLKGIGAKEMEPAEQSLNGFLAGPVAVRKVRIAVTGHPEAPLALVVFLYDELADGEGASPPLRGKIFWHQKTDVAEKEIPSSLDEFLAGLPEVREIECGVVGASVHLSVMTVVLY